MHGPMSWTIGRGYAEKEGAASRGTQTWLIIMIALVPPPLPDFLLTYSCLKVDAEIHVFKQDLSYLGRYLGHHRLGLVIFRVLILRFLLACLFLLFLPLPV